MNNQLNIHKIKAENANLKAFKAMVMKFLEKFNLKEQFNKFMAKSQEKER